MSVDYPRLAPGTIQRVYERLLERVCAYQKVITLVRESAASRFRDSGLRARRRIAC
jgi:hypothetical protein